MVYCDKSSVLSQYTEPAQTTDELPDRGTRE